MTMSDFQSNNDEFSAPKKRNLQDLQEAKQTKETVHLGVTKEGEIIPAREGTSPMPGVWLADGPQLRRESNDPSVIYETENDEQPRRLKIGSQMLKLAPNMDVDLHLEADGSGQVFISVPASSIKVIPAGKRVTKYRRRDRDSKKVNDRKTDAD